jgi:hypothetical protein
MDGVFQFIGLPQSDIENLDACNTRAYAKMGPGVQAKLDAFYAPYNAMLSALLEEFTGDALDMSVW